jgi:hypothetical protein
MSHLSMCIKYYPLNQVSSQRHYTIFQAWIWEGWRGVLLGRYFLGQGVFPKWSLSRPCEVDEVVKDKDSMGMGFMAYKGL